MDSNTWLEDVETLVDERFQKPRCPKSITVLFDPSCALCRRCRDWMLGQPAYVSIRFLPCNAEEAHARFGDIPWLGDELIVVGDGGEVWVGPAAFLTCLWALEAWREWSYRLAGPAFAPLAERFFLMISDRRKSLSTLLSHQCADGVCSRAHG